jgi:hypothetical protein
MLLLLALSTRSKSTIRGLSSLGFYMSWSHYFANSSRYHLFLCRAFASFLVSCVANT